MGTRFCATQEAPIHERIKQLIVINGERDTNLIFRSLHNTARVAKTGVSDEVVRRLSAPGATYEDVASLVRGAAGRAALTSGNYDEGLVWASMAQGLITDIPSVADLIATMTQQARSIVQARLSAIIESAPQPAAASMGAAR